MSDINTCDEPLPLYHIIASGEIIRGFHEKLSGRDINVFGNCTNIHGECQIVGDVTNIKGNVTGLWGILDGSVYGDLSIRGDISHLRGTVNTFMNKEMDKSMHYSTEEMEADAKLCEKIEAPECETKTDIYVSEYEVVKAIKYAKNKSRSLPNFANIIKDFAINYFVEENSDGVLTIRSIECNSDEYITMLKYGDYLVIKDGEFYSRDGTYFESYYKKYDNGLKSGVEKSLSITFETGATRENKEGKGRYDLLPFIAIDKLAKYMQSCLKSHEARNWEKGINMSSYLDSTMRHISKYMAGCDKEDHLIAALWNIACAIQTEELLKDMQDIPSRKNKGDLKL